MYKCVNEHPYRVMRFLLPCEGDKCIKLLLNFHAGELRIDVEFKTAPIDHRQYQHCEYGHLATLF